MEPHRCVIARLRGVVLHHKERIGAACAFVAHRLPVRFVPPVEQLAIVDRFAVAMIAPLIVDSCSLIKAPTAGVSSTLSPVLFLLQSFHVAPAHECGAAFLVLAAWSPVVR